MPTLVGERCFIRPHQRGEVEKLVKLRNRARNSWGWDTRFHTEQELLKDFEENGLVDPMERVTLAIVDKNTQDYLGAADYFDINWFDGSCELSLYLLGQDREGKGIGSEATRLICDHLMRDFPLKRIEAQCRTENEAARRVLEKNGFQLEGTKRMAAFSEGDHHDLCLYALTRPDWEDSGAEGEIS